MPLRYIVLLNLVYHIYHILWLPAAAAAAAAAVYIDRKRQ